MNNIRKVKEKHLRAACLSAVPAASQRVGLILVKNQKKVAIHFDGKRHFSGDTMLTAQAALTG